MRLKDRVAVVTGAGRGIGRAVAEKMAAQGARVVVADRDEALARETAAELKATPMVVDIGDPQSVEELFCRRRASSLVELTFSSTTLASASPS